MRTSYYAITPPTTQGAVSISRSVPRGTSYPRYWKLAPGGWFKSVSEDEYVQLYQAEILDKLDPAEVFDDLNRIAGGHEPILLCYEKPPKFCHRRLVADWLESRLGIAVPEISPAPSVPPSPTCQMSLF